MERADEELLFEIASNDSHLKQLYEEHVELEKEVEKISRYSAYSSSAALREKELKKAKLRGMDLIMSILNEHRHSSAVL